MKLTPEEMTEAGKKIAQILMLRKDHNFADRYHTAWGNKTPMGLFLTVERIMEEAKKGDLTV